MKSLTKPGGGVLVERDAVQRRGVGLGQLSNHDGGHAEDEAHAHDDEPKSRSSQSLQVNNIIKLNIIIYLDEF